MAHEMEGSRIGIRLFISVIITMLCSTGFSQSTSWKGTISTAWNDASNWTNGVPSATKDAIIGDVNHGGVRQPLSSTASSCRSLTIGGVVASTLTTSSTLVIYGTLTINSNGTFSHGGKKTITIKGDWINNGTYSAASNFAVIEFSGTVQSLGGSVSTPFKKLTINTGSTVTAVKSLSVAVTFTVNGNFIPQENVTPVAISGAGALSVASSGKIYVTASTVPGNYSLSGSKTLATGSSVEYSGVTTNQTIYSSFTYSTLIISGAAIKSLTGNLPNFISSISTSGNIYINSGTLDLGNFTANRGTTVSGGALSVSNGATLKIGGTKSFPTGYSSNNLTPASTVEYNGTAQTIGTQTYGNLTFSSSSGAAVKTLPSTAMTITGNLSSIIGSGSSVSYTASANITVNGSINIGASTTFSGGSFLITSGSNWINNGTFTGSTGTVTFIGPGSGISGSGNHSFNNLTLAASQLTAAATSNITISGNLVQTLGNFTHLPGGSLTMNGTGKSVSGTAIVLDNMTISGTVTATNSLSLTGNLSVSGTLTAAGSTISMSGSAKSISGAGSIALGSLIVSGSVSTAISFSIANGLVISGSFSATSGTITFIGTSTFNGTANLNNVTLNGTSLQLSTNAVLGIAGAYTLTAGTLNVTSTIPNTVKYNGSGAQTVAAGTYNNLVLSGGNTKTAAGALTINDDITIATSTTFNSGSFAHIIFHDWLNNGTFIASTGTVQFTGDDESRVDGATTFNILTVNNNNSETVLQINDNVTTNTLNMTLGKISIESDTLTITGTRTGNGLITGTIKRLHAFNTGIAYAFEGPDNTITFASVSGVTSIIVSVIPGSINDFPYGASVNRMYTINVPTGTYNTTLRLHYDPAGLNGNAESIISLWKYNGTAWINSGKTANSVALDYVEQSGLTNINTRWTFATSPNVVRWNGSVSTNWNTAANWTTIAGAPSTPPSSSDIVEMGTGSFTNNPIITTAAAAKNIRFGNIQAVTLTINTGGSLTTSGDLEGSWTGNAAHSININNQSLIVNGDLDLSDAIQGHTINININAGTLTVAGSLNQSGSANIIFTGAGNLNIGNNYNYTNGTFTAASSTTAYNGSTDQTIGGVYYNDLNINKTVGGAIFETNATVGGNFHVFQGKVDNFATVTFNGNVTIDSLATLNNFSYLHIKGNWACYGGYTSFGAAIYFEGPATQNISASTFNNFNINKPVGSTAILTGNVVVNGDLIITSGTLDIQSFTCNRSVAGGSIILGDSATFIVGGNNPPVNFTSGTLANSSTVIANGTVPQLIFGEDFGNLILKNSGQKTLISAIRVNGTLTIESGCTFDAGSQVLTLNGNLINNGTFIPSTSLVIANGISKYFSGITTFNRLTVYGSYTLQSDVTINGLINITTTGYINGGTTTTTLKGDLLNSGMMTSLGTTVIAGTNSQTLSLINSTLFCKTVNFNGSVSPVLNSTSAPVFGFLNINNTGGINPSVGWTVLYTMNIASGAAFNGGPSYHTFKGSVVNNGMITSSGTLNYAPATAVTVNTGANFSSTGSVVFGGSGAITLSGSSPSFLQDVIISNTNAAGISSVYNMNVNNDFIINDSATFNAGSYIYNVGGDFECNGTMTGGTSSFSMSGPDNTLTASYNRTTFYDLTITGAIASQSEFQISHNFTNNNSFDASIGSVDFTGTLPGIIGGTASPFALAQFEILKSRGTAVTLSANLTGVLSMEIDGGIFDMGAYSSTQDTSGSNLILADSAILKIGGTSTLPLFSTYAIDTLGTVEYYGTNAVSSVTPYGNLNISGTGTKTASAGLSILNNFSLTNGSFTPGSFADTLGGNWNMSGGVFNNTGNTIILKGTGTQSLSSTGALNNLTINKPSGIDTLAGNLTINGILNFISGKVQTGNYTVILPSGASVSGTAQNTGWVNGKLQKNVTTGSNVARTFEVGGNNNYTPASILVTSVTTAGNLAAWITNSEHPQIGNSGLDSNKSVNRYWSFTNIGIQFTNAAVTLNWVTSDLDTGITTSTLKVGNFSSNAWTQPTVTSALSTSIQVSGVTAFGDMAIGQLVNSCSWTGNVNTNWNNTGNWSNGLLPVATINITIPAGRTYYPVLNSGTGKVKNIIISSGASITITTSTLQISGTISNTGIFNVSNGTVELNGTATQTIPSGSFAGNSIANLIISNNVTLAGIDTITGILSFGSVNNKLLSTGGYLVLKATSSYTASVGDLTNGGINAGNNITGNVTVERYIPGRRKYRLITSSVTTSNNSVLTTGQESASIWGNWQNSGINTSANMGNFITGGNSSDGFDIQTPNASLFTYDDVNRRFTGFTSSNGKNTKYTPLKAGVPYYMFVYGDRLNSISATNPHSTLLIATGSLKTGNQVYDTASAIPLSPVTNRFTMLGNPFASSINWATIPKANISSTFWGWDPNLSKTGGFITVNTTGTVTLISPYTGTTGLDQYIQPGQGFFVKTTGATPSLTIREQDKVSNFNSLAFSPVSAPNNIPLLAVNLFYETGGVKIFADGALVAFDQSFFNQTSDEDAVKMENTGENVSVKNDSTLLSIDARQLPSGADTLALIVSGLTKTQYTLQIFANQIGGGGLTAYLEDRYQNSLQPLSLNDTNNILININPAIPATFDVSRFRILFNPSFVILPLSFVSLKASGKENGIQVSWEVEVESGIQKYEVDRSADGVTFIKMAEIAVAGNRGVQTYQWLDQLTLPGNNFYRVRAIQRDGKYLTSKTVLVKLPIGIEMIAISPNPVIDKRINIIAKEMEKGTYSITISNSLGQIFFSQNFVHPGGRFSQTINAEMHRGAGYYYLTIINGPKKFSQPIFLQP